MTHSVTPTPDAAIAETVSVALGDRSYEILIGSGLIDRAGDFIAPLLPRPKLAIVTDSTVAELHLPRLQKALDAANISHDTYCVPAVKKSKNFRAIGSIMRLAAGAKKLSARIALSRWGAE